MQQGLRELSEEIPDHQAWRVLPGRLVCQDGSEIPELQDQRGLPEPQVGREKVLSGTQEQPDYQAALESKETLE